MDQSPLYIRQIDYVYNQIFTIQFFASAGSLTNFVKMSTNVYGSPSAVHPTHYQKQTSATTYTVVLCQPLTDSSTRSTDMTFPSPLELLYVLIGGLEVTRARMVHRPWYGFKLEIGNMFLCEGGDACLLPKKPR